MEMQGKRREWNRARRCVAWRNVWDGSDVAVVVRRMDGVNWGVVGAW